MNARASFSSLVLRTNRVDEFTDALLRDRDVTPFDLSRRRDAQRRHDEERERHRDFLAKRARARDTDAESASVSGRKRSVS